MKKGKIMAQTKTQTQTKKEILGPSVDYLPLQEGKFTNLLIYLYEGRSLPNTAKLLANFLGISEAEVNSKHNLLLGTYQGINTHCSDFLKPKNGTYDKSVFLAGDIVGYGNDAKDYYGGILDIIQEWKDGKKKEEDAKSEIKEILEDRRKEAEKFKNAAEEVYNGVQAFLSVTQKDQGALVKKGK